MSQIKSSDILIFTGICQKSIYLSDSFKVYAFQVDKSEFPNIKRNKFKNVSVAGDIPDLIIDAKYLITATEAVNKYGTTYNVKFINREMPHTSEEVYKFLSEILTKSQADTLYKAYPDIITMVREGRDNEVDLFKLQGIGEKRFEGIKRKIIENFFLMDIVKLFGGLLSISTIRKLYDAFHSVEQIEYEISVNPYRSLCSVSGIGFKTADNILKSLRENTNFKFKYDILTSMERCFECCLYLLKENEQEGDTKMDIIELRKKCNELTPECIDKFTFALKEREIYYNKETLTVSTRAAYETEKYIADTIKNNINTNDVWDINIENYRKLDDITLTDEQIKTLSNVCRYKISILEGSAGSGKTNSTKALIKMLKENHKSFLLFAPTGRAAKVLTEYTGYKASTIHRGLGYRPPDQWTYGCNSKLNADVIIIDEFSMVDIWLFRRVIEALDLNKTRILLIGDAAQLPSVGAGNLLHDFISSGIVPVNSLTKIFRYSDGGLMKVATDVRIQMPYLNNSMKNSATTFGSNKDYVFIDCTEETMLSKVSALYKKLLSSGETPDNIQVLSAKNVGGSGTGELNKLLQKIANKNYSSSKKLTYGDTDYYIGDIVIQTTNNYKAKLYDPYTQQSFNENDDKTFIANGETGVVKQISKTDLVIDFDGTIVSYSGDDLKTIKLGYSISIHKSQGGSSKIIILCTPKSHTFMLNSNILYVGLTRMKERCFHFGNVNTINACIKKKINLSRTTFAKELLKDV